MLPIFHGKLGVSLLFRADHLGFHMNDDVLLLLDSAPAGNKITQLRVQCTLGGRNLSKTWLRRLPGAAAGAAPGPLDRLQGQGVSRDGFQVQGRWLSDPRVG